MPDANFSWKKLVKDPQKNEKLALYFQHLSEDPAPEAKLAREFLANSRTIAQKLIRDEISADPGDLDQVLRLGFFHLYGPDSVLLQKVSA